MKTNPLHWGPEEKKHAQSQSLLKAVQKNGKVLEEIKSKEAPKEMEVSLKGIEVVTLKGDKGDKGDVPTDEQLIGLILPLIPDPIPGKDGDDAIPPTPEDLLELIRPLIPEVKDGETPSDERLLALIRPLIPEPVKGKDGSPDTPDEVVEKVNTSEKKIKTEKVDGLKEIIDEVDRMGKFPTGKAGGGRAPLIIQGAGVKLSDHVTTLDFSTNLTASYSGGGRTPR